MVSVLYTDTTEAWKVAERRKRLWIGAAATSSAIALAAVATLAWSLLPDGPLRADAFMLATRQVRFGNCAGAPGMDRGMTGAAPFSAGRESFAEECARVLQREARF